MDRRTFMLLGTLSGGVVTAQAVRPEDGETKHVGDSHRMASSGHKPANGECPVCGTKTPPYFATPYTEKSCMVSYGPNEGPDIDHCPKQWIQEHEVRPPETILVRCKYWELYT